MNNPFMMAAIVEAKKAATCGEVPVGAVIVKDGVIIASAHNMCEETGNPLLHAETVAICRAFQAIDDNRLNGCELYVTLEPCVMCCGAISHARLSRLYFGAYDKLAGGVVSKAGCFGEESPLIDIEYYCGIMEDECSALMTDFFKNLRK